MFEKEAEEYAKEKYAIYEITGQLRNFCRIGETFKDGAEFGYNKAKEEMQKNGLALQSDMDKTIEQNIQLKNQNNWLEGCKLELAEHLGKANDKISELEQQIEKMKAELHHRLVSPSHDDSDCLDKIVGLDRLWQFEQEF